jgi:hypothetical protein
MRKRGSAMALFALLAAAALLAAGCGGGGSSSSEAESDTTTVETTAEETETTTDDGDTSAFASKDCLELAGIGAKFAEAAAPTGAQSDPEAAAAFFEELVEKAPDEIKDDMAVLAEAIAEITTALKGIDLTGAAAADPETLAKLQELGEKFSDPKYQQASQNIEAWAKDNCSTSG